LSKYLKGFALCCVMALTILLSACGGASSSSNQKTIGIILIAGTDPANQQMLAGVNQEAKANGYTTTVVDANGSVDQANSAMQNLAARQVKAIIVAAFPSTSLTAGLNAAKQANIPVLSWGGGMTTGIGAATDEAPLAVPVTQKLISDMKGSGSVLALDYSSGFICRQRAQTFDSLMAKYPNIKVTKQEVAIPGYIQQASQFATAWLAAHPAGSGNLAIWGCWDGPSVGAISSLQQSHRTDVKVYGQNGESDAVNAVQANTMTATDWENSAQEGIQLVDTIGKINSAGSGWKPQMIDVPGILIDSSTIGSFLQQHPDALKS
jgi:ribose transport system substrate-binding protein